MSAILWYSCLMFRIDVSTLTNPPALLAPDAMARHLRQALPDWADVQWTSATGSTNTDLLNDSRAGLALPRLRGSHLQERGRGRANRNFHTAPGDALTFSCAFATRLPPPALPTLSVLAGLVACETLARELPAGHRLCLKWPNDLQWDEAKLAGILLEGAGLRPGAPARIVIGLGLNLRGGAALSASLGRPVADWQATGCLTPPVILCADIARAWQTAILRAEAEWHAIDGLATLPARYAAHDALAGRAIDVIEAGDIALSGLADGVTPSGQLRVQSVHGLRQVSVGDISVRASQR